MDAAATNQRQCPRCLSALALELYEGVEIDQCPTCEGAYLDSNELSKILRARGVSVDAFRPSSPNAGIPNAERHIQVACPGCGTEMKPVNFNYSSGTILDRCPTCHGLWCDGQELERAQAHYETHEVSIRQRKPALIRFITDIETNAATNLTVYGRWRFRKMGIGLLWGLAAVWAAWESASPTSRPAVLIGGALPAFLFGFWMARCPACAKPPVIWLALRPWALFLRSDCQRCGVPLTRT